MTEQQTARRFPVLGVIAFVLLAAILLTLAVLSAIKGVRTAESHGNVVRVEDGRTLVVNMDGTEETVTLAGVMVPRPASEGEDPTAENCLADEAMTNLSTILEAGDSVRLEFPDDADGPGGSRLALVHHGGEVVNIQQAEAGLAVPLPEQPMEQFGTELREAQETARTEETGLYSPAVPCTLAGQIAPAITALLELPEERPTTSAEADAQIETVSAAIEQGVTAEKVFATIDPEGNSVTSLAWGADAPRLRERLDSALSAAQSELDSLNSSRNFLLNREREDAQRKAEEARQAELERQRQLELERQEAARQAEQQREEAARQDAARQEAERQADEDRRKAEESASPTPTPTPSPSETEPSSSPDDSESSEGNSDAPDAGDEDDDDSGGSD